MNKIERLFKIGLISGFAGWAIDNAYTGSHMGYSWVTGGEKTGIPWMPVYAAGGIALSEIVPRVQGWSAPERVLAYGLSLGALEWGACKLDRSLGRCSWNYSGACTDVEHIAAFGVLSLILEGIFTGKPDPESMRVIKSAQ